MMERLIRIVIAALAALALAGALARAQDAPGAHGLAVRGAPGLPAGFGHLPYADPAARKGGKLSLGFQGTFDSLNPFNLKAG